MTAHTGEEALAQSQPNATAQQSITGADLTEAAEAYARTGETGGLISWAALRGREEASRGSGVETLISVILSAQSGLPSAAGVDKEMLTSAVQAYITASTGGGEGSSDAHLRERVSELTALHRINSAANSSLNLGDMLSETAQAVVAVTGADICSIFLYEPEWDQLVLTATSGLNKDAVGKVRLQLGEGITGWAALVGKPLAVRDAWADPRFKYIPALQEEKAVSIMAVPVVLFTKEKLLGVITVHTFAERDFSENGIRFLETVAGEIAIAIENAR
ncbi:MAG TPA: GAF domain-containing protein, partial [Chloroflexia bacterium]|nr:GAF domain-containing protein [Chloroflexia bacterium]